MPRKKTETQTKTLSITLLHSAIGREKVQKDTLKALGFTKLHQTVKKADNPAIRGMIKTVQHLVEVKEEA